MNHLEQKPSKYLEAFLLARRAENLQVRTIKNYRIKLQRFIKFCNLPPLKITPTDLREFLLSLEGTNNAGGIYDYYRCIKTYLRWFENEFDPPNWINPIKKIKPPRCPVVPLDPVKLEDVAALIKVSGVRDTCIFMVLLDTGVRSGSELLPMNTSDVDLLTGSILVRCGKGGKPRTVFLGSHTRKSLRKYLQQRDDDNEALWVTDEGTRLTYTGLRMMVQRRAKAANIPPPTLHSFRRSHCLNMLNAGCDLISLTKEMGWSSLSVALRYAKQSDEDIRLVHSRFSPVDNRLFG